MFIPDDGSRAKRGGRAADEARQYAHAVPGRHVDTVATCKFIRQLGRRFRSLRRVQRMSDKRSLEAFPSARDRLD
jgi:predicted ATPase